MAASEAVALLETLRAQVAEVAAHGREMLRRVRGGQLDTKEVRSQALLWYLQDLALLVCSKSRGGSLRSAGEPWTGCWRPEWFWRSSAPWSSASSTTWRSC
ncbi:neuroguidin isoform X2 [Agelaius phoeniceus]|uniref:neuroguidin isoform X2 n=1 Tax=Agelaius phoeniceus TaxID=39638 RepID=UPI004054A67D